MIRKGITKIYEYKLRNVTKKQCLLCSFKSMQLESLVSGSLNSYKGIIGLTVDFLVLGNIDLEIISLNLTPQVSVLERICNYLSKV